MSNLLLIFFCVWLFPFVLNFHFPFPFSSYLLERQIHVNCSVLSYKTLTMFSNGDVGSVWTFPKVWWLRVVDAMMKRCVSFPR